MRIEESKLVELNTITSLIGRSVIDIRISGFDSDDPTMVPSIIIYLSGGGIISWCPDSHLEPIDTLAFQLGSEIIQGQTPIPIVYGSPNDSKLPDVLEMG